MKRIIVCSALVAIIAALCASPVCAAWNFVHITDVHVDTTNADVYGQTFGKMMDTIRLKNPAPAFVIVSGDLTDHGMTGNFSVKVDSANWRCLTRKMYKNGNTWYAKYSGGIYSIPIYFTPGNHDDRVDNVPYYPGLSLNGYDQFIGYNSSKKPVSPTGVTCTFGTGTASRDYYFTYGNALVISMYSGTDAGDNVSNPSSAGLTSTQLTFLSDALYNNSARNPKIIFLHNPAADANGTDVDGTPFTKVNGVNDGCFSNYLTEFRNKCDEYPNVIVFQGHVEQNVVCDRNGATVDKNWTGGTRYVQTAACKDGAYRVMDILDGAPDRAWVNDPKVIPANPSVRILSPITGTLSPANALLTVDAGAWDADKIDYLEFFVNGTYSGTATQKPFTRDVVIPATKSTPCVIAVKAHDKLGNTNTASVVVNKAQGGDSYYDRLTVGSTVYVNCPKCKGTMSVTFNEIRVNPGNGKRQADLSHSCGCGGWSALVDVEQAYRLGGGQTGLFVYPARIFDNGSDRCSDIMIAPYQYPTVDIVYPMAGQSTNICEVQLATNYSGKNVQWTNSNQKPNIDGVFTNLSERFVWDMSQLPDPRTLTVTLKDAFGTQVSKSVTVTYDPSKPFYVYRGPLGDSWKGRSISFRRYPNYSSDYKTIVMYNYWNGSDPMGDHWGGESAALDQNGEISIIAGTIISSALSQAVPGNSTPVYVVDKNEYNSGTLNDGYWGTITWKEIYDRLAGMLGKDSNGKYRVWASASEGTRSSDDALTECMPPTVAISAPANGGYLAGGATTTISATATDDVEVDKVDFYVDGALLSTATAAPYKCNWTTPVTPGTHTILARAFDKSGRSAETAIKVNVNFSGVRIVVTKPNYVGGDDARIREIEVYDIYGSKISGLIGDYSPGDRYWGDTRPNLVDGDFSWSPSGGAHSGPCNAGSPAKLWVTWPGSAAHSAKIYHCTDPGYTTADFTVQMLRTGGSPYVESDWNTVQNVFDNTKAVTSTLDGNAYRQGIRLVVTKPNPSGDDNARIREIEVYDENGSKISGLNGDYNPGDRHWGDTRSNLVDGDLSWGPSGGTHSGPCSGGSPAKLWVTWGGVRPASVMVYHESSYRTVDFSVQMLKENGNPNNEADWVTQQSITGNTQDVTMSTVNGAALQGIRLVVTRPNPSGEDNARIREIEVYSASGVKISGLIGDYNPGDRYWGDTRSNLVDGDLSWGPSGGTHSGPCSGGSPAKLWVTWGGARPASVFVYHEQSSYRTADFSVQMLKENGNPNADADWVTQETIAGNSRDVTQTIVSIAVRQGIRLVVTRPNPSGEDNARIREIEVYSASGSKISGLSGDYSPGDRYWGDTRMNLVDGDLGWNSNGGAHSGPCNGGSPAKLWVTWGGARPASVFVYHEPSNRTVDFSVQMLKENGNPNADADWVTQETIAGNSRDVTQTIVSIAVRQGIRLVVTKPNPSGEDNARIREIEVYSASGSKILGLCGDSDPGDRYWGDTRMNLVDGDLGWNSNGGTHSGPCNAGSPAKLWVTWGGVRPASVKAYHEPSYRTADFSVQMLKENGNPNADADWVTQQSFTGNSQDVTNTTCSFYGISGNVNFNGIGLLGVKVSTGNVSAISDASGNYTISEMMSGEYTLTPSRDGYTFSPTSLNVTVSGSNVSGKDFTASSINITGNVSINGIGLPGATVSAGNVSATTDASGNYTISEMINGSYTVTPNLDGYTFSPTSINVTVSGSSVTGKDFTASGSIEPVAHWKLDEGSGATTSDVSGYGNTGTLVNGPEWVSGINGNALKFDGDDYVDIPNSPCIQYMPAALTVGAWFKPADATIDGEIVTKNGPFGLRMISSKLCGWILAGSPKTWTNFYGVTTLSNNTWYHAVLTYDGASCKLYLNGCLEASIAKTGPLETIGRTTYIGYGQPAFNQYFKGTIDEVRIYNRALGEAEVRDIYLQGGVVVAHWKLDEGPGEITAYDATGLGNNGMLVNGPTWVAGQVGNGLSFDGTNDRVKLPNNVVNGFADLTFTCWIKTSDANSAGIISGAQSDASNNEFIVLMESDGRVTPYIKGASSRSTADVNDGAWHHLAVTRSGSTVKVYKDAVTPYVWSSAPTGALSIAANGLWLGGEQDLVGGGWSMAQQLSGILDEVRIYNKALSAAEIETLYVQDRYYTSPRIAAGSNHSLALRDDGTIATWGYNLYGQLGVGDTLKRKAPEQVINLYNAMAVNAGNNHSLAIKSDGTVWSWGYNGYGQLGDSTTTKRKSPVQVKKLSRVIMTAGGAYHSLALKSDGTVWAWGRNNYYQLGDSSTTQRNYPVQTKILSGVVTIAAGDYHSLALKGDGTVWAWGYDVNGQLGMSDTLNRMVPVQITSLSGIVAIAAGDNHSLAMKSDGTTWAWGKNSNGQLGDSTTIKRTSPVQVKKISGIVAITGGGNHSLAIKSDGTAWAWGYNGYGQLGDSTVTQRTTPVQVKKMSNVKAITAGGNHTLGSSTSDMVWSWGYNVYGQLGIGDTLRRTIPTQITGLLVKDAAGTDSGNDIQDLVKPDITLVTKLNKSYPNPFNRQSTISFQLAAPAQTTIKVYNITGQVVKTLVNECLRPGYHSVKWDGKSENGQKVAAGVYLYRMSAGNYSKTNKLTVLR